MIMAGCDLHTRYQQIVVLDDLVEENAVLRHDAARLTKLLLEEFLQRRSA